MLMPSFLVPSLLLPKALITLPCTGQANGPLPLPAAGWLLARLGLAS